jgi:hypothetical protein
MNRTDFQQLADLRVREEDARYRTSVSQAAVDGIFDAALHPIDGILAWLKTLW